MSVQTLTFLLAFYGAFLSSILAIREFRKDKRRILIMLKYIAFHERAEITITNTGHRPITISEIGMDIYVEQNGKGFWEPIPRNSLFDASVAKEPFPETITDGENITIPLSDIISQEIGTNRKNVRVSVYDIEGKQYTKFKTMLHDPKWGFYGKTGS